MRKKVVVILLVLGVALVLAGIGAWFFLAREPADMISPTEPTTTTPSIPQILTWKDPAGFIFEYPSGLKIDNHPEDEINYANLEITSPGKTGKIKIMASDTKLKKISEWEKGQKEFSMTSLAGKEAKKIILGTDKTTIGTIDSDILFTVETEPETDSSFWQKIFDQIVLSFEFFYPTPASGSPGGGDIIEEEEIIE